MKDVTLIWYGPSGAHFAEANSGWTLNGLPAFDRPEWADGPAQAVFGEMRQWTGGKCPVAPTQIVRALFRGRRPYIGEAIWSQVPDRLKDSVWMHAPSKGRTDPAADIVAYQLRIG